MASYGVNAAATPTTAKLVTGRGGAGKRKFNTPPAWRIGQKGVK